MLPTMCQGPAAMMDGGGEVKGIVQGLLVVVKNNAKHGVVDL